MSTSGSCVQSITCGSSWQYSNEDRCVVSCPYGTYAEGRSCVRVCGRGQYYDGRYCVDRCAERTFNNGYGCEVICVKVNGVCAYGSSELGCKVDEYLNFTSGRCQKCITPCATCSVYPNNCTSCLTGVLVGSACISTSGKSIFLSVINATRSGNLISIQLKTTDFPNGITNHQQNQFLVVTITSSKTSNYDVDTFQFYQGGFLYVNLVSTGISDQ